MEHISPLCLVDWSSEAAEVLAEAGAQGSELSIARTAERCSCHQDIENLSQGTAEVPRRQKTKGVTIVSHGSIKSFGFEPVFFLIPFQKIA